MPKETKTEDGACHIRSPICVFEGHVDHGKSSLLDRIRGSTIVDSEPGKITQGIGAYLVPIDEIKKRCGSMLSSGKVNFSIPGLLFIDTPGHAAFTSLRKRGGSLADFAVVVVDINEGFMPQTEEAITILRANKTPFVLAANKIDLIPGWQSIPDSLLINNIQGQGQETQALLDERIYKIVGKLYTMGFASERFDRVENYANQIAIVPVSAKSAEGIPELLSLIIGLVQRYLHEGLHCDIKGSAKGSVLEVKEEPGWGNVIDAIIYDGALSKTDTIVIGGLDKPIVAKVRGLLEKTVPHRKDRKYDLVQSDEVFAAASVEIIASEVEGVISGMPIISCSEGDVEKAKLQVQAEVEDVVVETDESGIILKAANLGVLEAMLSLFREKGIKIRKASLGAITKKDVMEAESNIERNPLDAVIIGFEVAPDAEAKEQLKSSSVKIILSNIIYTLLDSLERFRAQKKDEIERSVLDSVTAPCKIQIMPNFIFRMSNPAIVGVDILGGTLKVGMPLMKEGKNIAYVKGIQADNESMSSAGRGKQVAVSIDGVTVGRQINPGDILFSFIIESEFVKLKKSKAYLKEDEIEVLRELSLIMRKDNPVWGI
jgi:translation initiation factor 5B